MFAQRGFVAGMGVAITFFLGVASFGLVLTLFLQQGLGFTPLHAGATFIPFSAGVVVASGAAARLEPKFGRGVTMSGALIMAAAMAILIGVVHHYGAAVSTWDLTPGLALAGLGLGTVIAPLANVVLADVKEQDAGSASGVLNTGFQLGNSIGLAPMGVVFIDRIAIGASARAFAAAIEHALWFQVGVFGLAFLLMLALPARRGPARRGPARRRHNPRPEPVDPARRQSVQAGWELFKRELHIHHTAEDEIIWPALRPRLAHSPAALSVLAAMEAEHELIDPLLAAVDDQFAATGDRVADVIDALTSSLTGHLRHEERDGLPLIGVALTAAEWRRVGRKMATKNGLAAGGEMFAWILDDTDRDRAAVTLAQLPPPLRLLYRARWKPRFDKTSRW
jgi:MFS family permease